MKQSRIAEAIEEGKDSPYREDVYAELTKAKALLAECQRLTKKDGSSLWEVIHEFLGSPEADAYNSTQPGE